MLILGFFLYLPPISSVSLKYFGVMIRIYVFANEEALRLNNHCFERIVNWDNSLKFPVESVVQSFKALWGEKAVVQVTYL